MLNRPKIIFGLIAIAAVLALGFLFSNDNQKIPDVKAAATDNVRGFAWSENIGWISFNSMGCDIDGDGIYEGAGEFGGPAPAGCPIVGAVITYGVNLDLGGTNNLSGYAWSENIGWISFEAADIAGCPSGGTCQPRLIGADFYGWARALANGGGWGGWISLISENCDIDVNNFIDVVCGGDNATTSVINYNTILNGTDFEGFAWSDMVVGWLSFNSKNCDPLGTGSSGIGGCPLPVGASIPAYKVYLLNTPPTVTPLNPLVPNYCVAPGVAGVLFSWDYTDVEDLNIQEKYQLIISREDGKVYDSGVRTSQTVDIYGTSINSEANCVPGPSCTGFIDYGSHTYSWTIQVWDSVNLTNGPKAGNNFGPTPLHQYPDVGFAPPPPASFLVNSSIDFTVLGNADSSDNTKCYPAGDNTDCKQWIWDFDYDGATFTSDRIIIGIDGNWTHIYSLPNSSYRVVLQVTDNDDYTCSNFGNPEMLGATRPKWKEVVPR